MEEGEEEGIREVRDRLESSSDGGSLRWVDGSEIEGSLSRSWPPLGDESSYGSVSLRRRLFKNSKRDDSFDGEAMEVSGYHGFLKDPSMWQTLAMAFQTLGVVYGDMGTSPLYVFSNVFTKVPITSDIDVVGALSLVMYTIALLPLAKYVFVVLKANDNGEGGPFALYSLICRYAKVHPLPNHQVDDEQISNFKLKLPSPELERALNIKETLEQRSILKTVILLLVMIGTSLIIGDGILTPAISVMSAVDGLQDKIPGFGTNAVVIVSTAILVMLFSVQRFGTNKVAFAFAPILALWFLSLGAIGIYNLAKYDISVIRAFNPAYIFYFFKKNTRKAWSSLGGCLLCITGAEAMFADIGHFSVLPIQIAFTCVVFPCLMLAYMGQAAYLMKHSDSAQQVFYNSIPGMAEVGVMIVSTALLTLVMVLIWQKNLYIALCFPLIFGSVELIYLSASLSKLAEGGWLPLVFATFFLFLMYIWNYGSVLKYQSEVRDKISTNFLLDIGSSLGTIRVPGIGLLYNELVQGIPSVFGRFLLDLPATYSTLIFVCIKNIPIPMVPEQERFLFRRVGPKEYKMFRCVARYGYKDVRKEEHSDFERLLVESLKKFLTREDEDFALENGVDETDDDSFSPSDDGTDELRVPLMSDQKIEEIRFSLSEEDPRLEHVISSLQEDIGSGFTYLLGHSNVRAKKDSWFIKKLVINYFYAFLRRNCRGGAATMRVPHINVMRVGMRHMV